ncbi:hypothetical protein SKAU_G00402440 [Synaphobranchus kaupii]|uniref:Secreted protein n=1 Tax=Synaphobranchus kaupii TaxID=118154 RepID=A0A9Q1IBP4_SYNKA|nr:hypothetical protein SKAU_G00402440 [Synaphobranchus kaupii]
MRSRQALLMVFYTFLQTWRGADGELLRRRRQALALHEASAQASFGKEQIRRGNGLTPERFGRGQTSNKDKDPRSAWNASETTQKTARPVQKTAQLYMDRGMLD